ncbi:MAG TPA: LemA family protein [Armatimonadota bacterium]|nr:LemA family protein [Armatimonadota bacterium]
MIPILIVVLFIACIIWFVVTYNRFIHWQNLVKEAWSGIDVQLKRRYDLVPNIVETIKGYTGHEKDVFTDISALRAGSFRSENAQERSTAENALTRSIKGLFAVVEAYPNLKANQQFLTLQNTLIEIEDQIQYARRYYNGAVRNYNILVQTFPSNIIASFFKFAPREYFEIELITERNVPEVQLP